MSIQFLSRGPLDQVSGGHIYNRYLIEYLRAAGADVRYHGALPDLRVIDASDTVVVDSLVVDELATRLLHVPGRLVLLLHMAPAVNGAARAREAELESLFRRAHLVVTGDETLSSVREHMGVPVLGAVKIEPGVPEHWRAKPHYSDRAGLLLGAANYVPGKGILQMIDALRQLKDLPWTLTLHGNRELDPDYFAACARRVEAYRLGDRIDLQGPVPHVEVNRKMLEADLLVHFSRSESYSMVTAEAIASGLPVASYPAGNVCGFRRSGLVRYFGDCGASPAETLAELIGDPVAYARLRPGGTWRPRRCGEVGRDFLIWLEGRR